MICITVQSTAQGSQSSQSILTTSLIQTCLLSNTDKTTFWFLNCCIFRKVRVFSVFSHRPGGVVFVNAVFAPLKTQNWAYSRLENKQNKPQNMSRNLYGLKKYFLIFVCWKRRCPKYTQIVQVNTSAYPPLPTQPKTTSASPLPLWSDSAGGTPRCQLRGPSETWESETPPLLLLTASCHCTPCTPVPTETPRRHHTTSQLTRTYITTCFWIFCSLAYSARTLFLSFLPLGTKSLCSFFFALAPISVCVWQVSVLISFAGIRVKAKCKPEVQDETRFILVPSYMWLMNTKRLSFFLAFFSHQYYHLRLLFMLRMSSFHWAQQFIIIF